MRVVKGKAGCAWTGGLKSLLLRAGGMSWLLLWGGEGFWSE